MKIFAISVIKNEADIIAASLTSAKKWADKIFVLDNGSTDGSWEIVRQLADNVIIPWRQDFQPFHDGIRAQVYHHFKGLSSPGDWWCFRLDADEFYDDDVRDFLKGIPPYYGQVLKRSIDFVLVDDELLNTQNRLGKFDRANYKYISKNSWCELRFFRQTINTKWQVQNVLPSHVKPVYPKKIDVFHYQYRSFEQVQKRVIDRLASKNQIIGDGRHKIWAHIRAESAADYFVPITEVLEYSSRSVLEELKEINGKPYPTYFHWLFSIMKSVLHIT